MTARKMAVEIVNGMTDEQLKSFILLFQGIIYNTPNEKTLAAMKEVEEMTDDPSALKFDSVDELLTELRS